jgi:hypothetical protein
LRQAPASHLPSVPQPFGPWSTQVLAGSGAPGGTLAQTPIDPERAHDRHAPAQAVTQQTPWAQLPDAHSPGAEQKEPIIFWPHELTLHTLGATQFASLVQAPKHLFPLHANGEQGRASGGVHAPVLLHSEGGV